MKNVMKKVCAAVLSAAMCLSFAGCYSENKTWAAKQGDDTMPIGGYVYYLNSAYSEAMSKVSTEEEVLKATIDGIDAKTWIENRAENYLKAYYYIDGKFNELGLELTEDDQDTITANTDSMWTYYKTSMEEMGIAKESFNKAFTEYNTKYQKVMKAMYAADGELAVSDDELKEYITDNYYSYEYFSVSLTKTDDDGNSVDMTDEEKEETEKKLKAYITKINNGEMTVEEAAEEYAEDALGSAENSTYYAPSPVLGDNMLESIKNAIDEVEDNTATLAETTSGFYLVRRLSISEKFDEINEDADQRFNYVSNMKSEDFSDFVMEQAESVEGVEINTAALKSVKVSSMVGDSNKNGTSSAPEDETDEGSSEVESEAESEVESDAE